MANNPVTTTERERTNSTLSPSTAPYPAKTSTGGVNVYDRPVSPVSPSRSPLVTIIAVLVLLILVYLLYQWIF